MLLAALGLALSFGLMRRHQHGPRRDADDGRLSHLHARCKSFGRAGYPVGLVVAFVGTALFGALLEITLIRRLYGRPLDTLLATWGVSLILQQAARSIFGPIGVEVTAPRVASGSISLGERR